MENTGNTLLDKINALKRGEKIEFEFLQFEDAIKALKQGNRITRIDWLWVGDFHPYLFTNPHGTPDDPCFYKQFRKDAYSPYWSPTNIDMFADDWIVL